MFNLYQISKYGFLGSKSEEHLPQELNYLKEFYEIYHQYQSVELRNAVDNYPFELPKWQLSELKLSEIQHIYSLSGILVHLYVYSEKPYQTEVPKILGKIWWDSAKLLDLDCQLNYSCLVLYNWKLKDSEQDFSLENIEPRYQLLHDSEVSKTEYNYLKTLIAIEGLTGSVIHDIDAVHMNLGSNSEIHTLKLEQLFKNILDKLEKQTELYFEIFQKCIPNQFYYQLYQWYRRTPEDIIMLEIENHQYQAINVGSFSFLQSSLFQVLDIFFDIELSIEDRSDLIIQGIPGGHLKYLEFLKKKPKILSDIADHKSKIIQKLYYQCLKEIMMFRNTYLEFIKKYVFNFEIPDQTLSHPLNIYLKKYLEGVKELSDIIDTIIEEEDSCENAFDKETQDFMEYIDENSEMDIVENVDDIGYLRRLFLGQNLDKNLEYFILLICAYIVFIIWFHIIVNLFEGSFSYSYQNGSYDSVLIVLSYLSVRWLLLK